MSLLISLSRGFFNPSTDVGRGGVRVVLALLLLRGAAAMRDSGLGGLPVASSAPATEAMSPSPSSVVSCNSHDPYSVSSPENVGHLIDHHTLGCRQCASS